MMLLALVVWLGMILAVFAYLEVYELVLKWRRK
jgi:hypothetical protein